MLYEDDHLLVVDKPVGIITADPAASGAGGRHSGKAGNTVFDILKDHVRAQRRPRPTTRPRDGERSRSADRPVWIIHRLDKEASGLLVFAKTEAAFNWLKEDLRAKRIDRIYLAVAEGAVGAPGEEGVIQAFIADDQPARPTRRPRRGDPAPSDEPRDRPAITHYQVIAAGSDRTLLRIRLDTGRKNQIRIHFSTRGHPLLGDRRFGAKTNPIDRLALHAAELRFRHPATGQEMRFTSPAPGSFYRIVGADPPPPPPAPTPPPAEPPTAHAPPARTPVAPPPPRPAPATSPPPATATSWDQVASWYDHLLEDRGNDHYEQVILPGALAMLEPAAGQHLLDVACGQGILGRRLAALNIASLGVEASPRLVQAAERRAREAGIERLARFTVGDARRLGELNLSGFDMAACIMALSNIEPIGPVFEGIAAALRPGGRLVWVITHPAFRAPDQSSWGWDQGHGRQYRRIDGYLSPHQKEIQMHPGRAARESRGSAETTWTFHRPLQTYFEAMRRAGLLVDRLEEWPSLRAATSGPRAKEENRARREIPLFLGVRAVKPLAPAV